MYTRRAGAPNDLPGGAKSPRSFSTDSAGNTSRFALAVIAAAFIVALGLTLVAEDLYRLYLMIFGP